MVGQTAKNNRLAAIGAFVTPQQLTADDAPRTAPAEVTQWLAEHARHIDAIEAHLLGGSELSWERDIEAGFDQPHPDRLGHRYLQFILLARALQEGRQGHLAEADKSLEASWILNRGLAGRHELISQLTALSIALTENGVLRVLPTPSIPWADRVLAQDFPAAFLRAFQAEAFLYTHAFEGLRGVPAFNARDATGLRDVGLFVTAPYLARDATPLRNVGALVTLPYFKLSVAGYSEQVRMMAELLRDRHDLCSLDLQAVSQAAEDALPRWNRLARTAMEGLSRAWSAVRDIRLDGELTRLVIEARRDSGEIARAHSSPIASTVCQSVSWIRTVSGSGRVTIAARPARPLRDESRREWAFSFGPQ